MYIYIYMYTPSWGPVCVQAISGQRYSMAILVITIPPAQVYVCHCFYSAVACLAEWPLSFSRCQKSCGVDIMYTQHSTIYCWKAELFVCVGFLCFNTCFQNFTTISLELTEVHQKFIIISPSFRQNIELEHLNKKG